MTRCRSESWFCRIWNSQCSSSTYGLPRNLQNTVAPSIALYASASSLPNRAARLISVMSVPLNLHRSTEHFGPHPSPLASQGRKFFALPRKRGRVRVGAHGYVASIRRSVPKATLLGRQDQILACNTLARRAEPCGVSDRCLGPKLAAGHVSRRERDLHVPNKVEPHVLAHPVAQLTHRRATWKKTPILLGRQRPDVHAELRLPVPHCVTCNSTEAKLCGRAANTEPGAIFRTQRQPVADIGLQPHRHAKQLRQRVG